MSTETLDRKSPAHQDPRLPLPDRAHSPREDEPAEDSYQAASEGQLIAPANFRPFFTLVEDANTGEHYHPHVHYIFADDDPDTLTSSLIDSLHTDQQDPNHRLLLVDVANDGRTVKSAHSLSSSWQVSQAGIGPAPSWTESGPEAATEGLMLKIDGAEAQKPLRKEKQQEEPEDLVQRLELDIENYTERLNHLQGILAKSSML